MTVMIKRCPFCGGRAIKKMVDEGRYKVCCTKCFCTTPTHRTQNLALLTWNRRVDDEGRIGEVPAESGI